MTSTRRWRPLVWGMTACGLLLAVWLQAENETDSGVTVAVLSKENWESLVPKGKEVDAIYGDLVLKNRYVTAVIARPLATRNANMTVRSVGGALIDLTVTDAPSDQLSAFYPGRRQYPFRSGTAAFGDDKSQTEVSFEELEQQGKTADAAAIVVTARGENGRPEVTVTYSLGAESRQLQVTTNYRNNSDGPMTVPLEDDLRADGGAEDMVKTPNGTGTLFWFHDRHWHQAYGIQTAGQTIMRYNSNSRTTTINYSVAGEQKVTLDPGQAVEINRTIFPGRNRWEVMALADDPAGTKTRPITLTVVDDSGAPLDNAMVRLNNGYGDAVTDGDGQIHARLLPGKYEVSAYDVGTAITTNRALPRFEVQPGTEAQSFVVKADNYRPGRVQTTVTDREGQPIAAKIEFLAASGTPTPEFGPTSGEEGVKNLQYAAHGKALVRVPTGEYTLRISHGPEYEIATETIAVRSGETTRVTASLKRSVDTSGWVSADFHSHSSPSGDNTGSQRGRVLNLVCEHIEFAPCTEHNRVSSYVPHIQAMGLTDDIATVSGMELTGSPLPLNHQNVFPMRHVPHTQDGGGPTTAADPDKQVERLVLWDDRSEKLIQENHPDLGWFVYDRDGDGEPDGGYSRALPNLDVVEIHPIESAWQLRPVDLWGGGRPRNHRIFNWLQMLNQGFRIYGVVNTDAHYNFHGSGGLRNWILSSTDHPGDIDSEEMRIASEKGHLVMSNGPFLTATVNVPNADGSAVEAVPMGSDVVAEGGQVDLHIRVQSPSWFAVDTVRILLNGRTSKAHTYSAKTHPEWFSEETVNFDRVVNLKLDQDTHIIVLAGSPRTRMGSIPGPQWGTAPPTALTNPIFVDVDDNGFQPNGDTLGAPLPVKSGVPRKPVKK